ncbi:MAG: hypothetical protein U0R17_06915 [Acidimicrobiia bacterium]
MQNKKVSFIFLIIVLITLFGCSTQKSEKLPRNVNSKQAQIFSQILRNNLSRETTKFQVTALSTKGANFASEGYVNWKNGLVSNSVSLNGSGRADLNAISNKDLVYENYFGLDTLMKKNNLTPKKWVSRTIDKSIYGIDSISQFILSLVSTTAENPLLLKQDGAQYLGQRKINGDVTSMFRKKGGDIVYYTKNDSTLLGVRVTLKGFTTPMLITFSSSANITIEVPNENDVYSIDDVSKFYFQNRPKF